MALQVFDAKRDDGGPTSPRSLSPRSIGPTPSIFSDVSSIYRTGRTPQIPVEDSANKEMVLCGCFAISQKPPRPGKQRKPKELTVAHKDRKLNDVYDVEPVIINYGPHGHNNHSIVHKCRHKVSKNVMAALTISRPEHVLQQEEDQKQHGRGKDGKRLQHLPPRSWAQIVDEVTIMKQLQHDNIILTLDVFQDETYVHVVTELCKGPGVFDPIIESGKFGERDAAIIVEQICFGLAYMHENKVVHRDLKPEAFQYFKAGRSIEAGLPLKIVDLSSAAHCRESQWLSEKVGTPYYFAPEVLSTRYNMQCDMWSLGVLLFILLSGWVPFKGESDSEIKQKIKMAQFSTATQEWKPVSRDAKEVVSKLLVVDPFARLTPWACLKAPWVKEHARGAGTNLLANGANDGLLKRLKTFTASEDLGGRRVRRSTVHIIAEQLKEAQVLQLRQMFDQLQSRQKMKLTELKTGLRQVGLKEFPLDPVRVVKDVTAGDNAEFCPASVIEWERLKSEAMYVAFRHTEGDAGGFIFPGEIRKLQDEDGASGDGTKINPLTTEIVAWIDGSKPTQSELRKLIAMLRGNRYF